MHLERLVRFADRGAFEVDAVLVAGYKAVAPAFVADRRIGVDARGRALRKQHVARTDALALARQRIRVLDDGAVAVALVAAKERVGHDLRAFFARQRGDRAVELFARGRVRLTDVERETAAAGGVERDGRRIAVNDRARQVELLAEARPQAGRADALDADDRVLLEDQGFHAGASGFAGRRSARRTAPDDQKFDVLHPSLDFARTRRISASRMALSAARTGLPKSGAKRFLVVRPRPATLQRPGFLLVWALLR